MSTPRLPSGSATDFVAVVPARLASTRLPNKPLADLAGKPMVVHAAERARESGARQVVIATDAQSVVDAVAPYGFDVRLTRADHANGTDRLAEIVEQFNWPDDTLVVNVQGDEPLIAPSLVHDVAVHLAAHPECALATAAHPIHAHDEIFNPNVIKVVLDAHYRALYFSRAPIPWARDAWQSGLSQVASLPLPDTPVYRHIGLYAYRASFLRRYPTLPQAPIEIAESLEQLRAMWHGERIAVLLTDDAPLPGIDTPEDLARVRALLEA